MFHRSIRLLYDKLLRLDWLCCNFNCTEGTTGENSVTILCVMLRHVDLCFLFSYFVALELKMGLCNSDWPEVVQVTDKEGYGEGKEPCCHLLRHCHSSVCLRIVGLRADISFGVFRMRTGISDQSIRCCAIATLVCPQLVVSHRFDFRRPYA